MRLGTFPFRVGVRVGFAAAFAFVDASEERGDARSRGFGVIGAARDAAELRLDPIDATAAVAAK